MASSSSLETTYPSLSAMHEEVAELLPTQKFHGLVRVPGLHEDIAWTLEVPEEGLAYEGLVLLVPGLGCVKRHSRGERHANAVAGEATISYAPPRLSGSAVEDILHSHRLHAQTASAVLSDAQRLFKGRSVVPGATHIDLHRVTLSPHSMGGYAATAVGLQRPGEIDTVVYKAAAGFGTPNWRALHHVRPLQTAREIISYATSDEVDFNLQNIWRSAYYFGRSPVRSYGEILTCLTRNIAEDVVTLGEKGVPTAYLGFEKDGLVPPGATAPIARKIVNLFEVLPAVGHLAPQRHPVETAAAVRGLRRRLRP